LNILPHVILFSSFVVLIVLGPTKFVKVFSWTIPPAKFSFAAFGESLLIWYVLPFYFSPVLTSSGAVGFGVSVLLLVGLYLLSRGMDAGYTRIS
jgi:hypothetical protein